MKVLCRSSADNDKPWPPGFRFHPTDEELILYYLKKKICGRKLKLDFVGDIDVYKWDPEELPGLSKLKTGDRQWFFFSPRDRKYPNGARSNRATRHGYWKATGKDRIVTHNSRNVGIIKTLVFYRGRAPNGDRTDWVMHEYTMDEEELSRCTNVQNYYAVYKLFKKSGPGPKNGEQYGAPFNEEDWADDEFCDFNNSDDQEILAKKPKTDTTVIEREACQATLFSSDDLDDMLMKQIDEFLFEFPEPDPCTNSLLQVGDQEESPSTVARSVEAFESGQQPSNAPERFELAHSDISQLQPCQTPEAKSAPNFSELARFLLEDDYLEMDDLGGTEFTQSNTEKPSGSGNSQFEGLTGLMYELDQFRDAVMFLNDLGPSGDDGTVPNLYQNENAENAANPMDGQFQYNPDYANASQIDNQMQMPDPSVNGFALSELQQTSGVLCDPSNFAAETNQNQVGEDENSASRVSSALWAFVESIPTTPASAAENDLVNQTFDQMSCLDRRKISMKSTTVLAIGSSSSLMSRRTTSRSRKGGFYLFSLLGALCAILWVFIGAVRLWQRCISL